MGAALFVSSLAAASSAVATPAAAAQDAASCGGTVTVINAGFEEPRIVSRSVELLPAEQVPGWTTNDAQNRIEIWSDGAVGVPSAEGAQFTELNATSASTLFQTVATTPGQRLSWSLQHRGRAGTDVMRVLIGAPGGPLTQSGPDISDGDTAWGIHRGTYTVPAGQTSTVFAFEAVSSVGGDATGNFLDDVTVSTGPCLVSDKSVTNLTRPDAVAQVGDVLRYTVTARNDGGSAVAATVSDDVLESGLGFVPGSLRILSGAGAGPLTDQAGDDRGEYDVASRTVRVRLGDGGSASQGGSLPAAGATTYSFDAKVTAAGAGRDVVNAATVRSGEPDGDDRSVSTTPTVRTPVAAATDLAIVKTLDRPLVAGETASFTLTASNRGPQTATGVTVTDPIPAGLTDVRAAPSQGDCAVAGGTITCALPDLVPGAKATVVVTGTVPADTAAGTEIANTARVTGALTDLDPENDVATASGTVVVSADLAIEKTASAQAVPPNGTVTYTLTVRNAGPSAARSVRVEDVLPRGLRDATAAGLGCTSGDGTLGCDLGTLPAGESRVVTVTAVIDQAAAGTDLANTATVSTTTVDPDPSDNSSTATTHVLNLPKADETPKPGETAKPGEKPASAPAAAAGADAGILGITGGIVAGLPWAIGLLAVGGILTLAAWLRRARRS